MWMVTRMLNLAQAIEDLHAQAEARFGVKRTAVLLLRGGPGEPDMSEDEAVLATRFFRLLDVGGQCISLWTERRPHMKTSRLYGIFKQTSDMLEINALERLWTVLQRFQAGRGTAEA